MSNVPDYRSPEQAHYETVRDLRARLEQAERELEQAERELEHYKSAYEEAEEINRLSAGEIYNIERQRDEARAELWDMSARVCELRHSYALVLRGPIPYTAGTAISDFIGSLDKVLSGSPAPTQNDADRLAAIERGVRELADHYHAMDAEHPGALTRAENFESELRAILDPEGL